MMKSCQPPIFFLGWVMKVLKVLRLVMPQYVQRRGIFAESPVFISYAIEHKNKCWQCGSTYQPIAYGFNRPVFAHHKCGQGGIFSIDANYPENLPHGLFIATGETVGNIIECSSQLVRSEGIILTSLQMVCGQMFCHDNIPSKRVVVGLNHDDKRTPNLKPLCYKCMSRTPINQYSNRISTDLFLDTTGNPLFVEARNYGTKLVPKRIYKSATVALV